MERVIIFSRFLNCVSSFSKLDEELVQEGSKLVEQQIEAIAVTVGPGQEHSLNEGIRFA